MLLHPRGANTNQSVTLVFIQWAVGGVGYLRSAYTMLWLTCRGDGDLVDTVLRERDVPRQRHPVVFRQLSSLRPSKHEQKKKHTKRVKRVWPKRRLTLRENHVPLQAMRTPVQYIYRVTRPVFTTRHSVAR